MGWGQRQIYLPLGADLGNFLGGGGNFPNIMKIWEKGAQSAQTDIQNKQAS